ncbi:PAS domain S-box protein [Pseudoroseomonas wenyumeiae]
MNPSNPAIGKDTYELLIHGLTDYAIYMLAPDGRVISWNPGAERIKGYTADEIIGEHFSRFYTEEDRSRCPRKNPDHRRRGRPLPYRGLARSARRQSPGPTL